MATYSDYNPAGTTRTTYRGIARHIPYLPNYFNHQWAEDYLTDFITKNLCENDGVISGCVVSQDGGNNALNTTAGEIYVNGVKTPVSSSGPYALTADGFYISYITSAGEVIHGYLQNSTVQGAVTPSDSVIIGYAVLGNGNLYVSSFANKISTAESEILDQTQQIFPNVVVGTSLSEQRVTDLETTFIASLSAGDRLLILDGVSLSANREIATETEIWMDTPDAQLDIGAFDLTLSGDISGNLNITGTGNLILNGVMHALIIKGTGFTVVEDTSFTGTYFLNGELNSKAQDILFTTQPDRILMTSAEQALYSNDEKYIRYDTASKTFKSLDGTTITPITGDWTRIKSIETLTEHLEFPSSYLRAKIDTDRHFQIPMGDQGGGIPYTIILHSNDADIDLITDIDFRTLGSLTDEQQRLIKNRGYRNIIKWNSFQIFTGFPQHFFDAIGPRNPYVLPENGGSFNGIADAGVNDGENCFSDLWYALKGNESLEIGPIFNPFGATALWKKVYLSGDGGRFVRPVAFADGTVDPEVHQRISPTSLSSGTITSYTSGGDDEISGISDTEIKKAKIGARIYDAGGGIPQESSFPKKTTLIGSIVHNGVNDNSIFLVDSETQSAINVSATGNLTIDFGGNTGLSIQDDAMQKITGEISDTPTVGLSLSTAVKTGVFSVSGTSYANYPTSAPGTGYAIAFDSSLSTSPNAAKTSDYENRSINVNRYSLWRQ